MLKPKRPFVYFLIFTYVKPKKLKRISFNLCTEIQKCILPYRVTLTSTSTLFNKNIDYNRLARKIGIANLCGPVKRKIK